MFKTYFKTAWRNLSRHKTNSLINIVGLIVGLSAFLLIFLVVQYEKGFDNFHSNADRIYRVVRIGRNPVNREYRTGVPFPVPAGLRSDIPGSAMVAAIQSANNVQILVGSDKATKRFKEASGVFAAEPQLFDILNFPLLTGSAASLKDPRNALLSKSLAEKYFGDWHKAIGQEFRIPPDLAIRVTGILQDPPHNTDFPLQMVVSYATLMEHRDPGDWGSIDDANYCLVKLGANQDAAQYSRQLSSFVEKRIKPVNPGYVLALQPLGEVHHDERYGTFTGAVFTNDLIIALSLIGAFLLVIACVNFINLTTAQAALRSREVGVRKVLGGNRRQLVVQFLGETGLTSLISLTGALMVVYIALPSVNSLLNTHISASVLFSAGMLVFLVGTLLVVTFLSGFYPALVLSAYRSAIVLKGAAATDQKGGALFRRGLVVFQFVIAQALIIGTLVVASQMSYFRNADMGFTRHAVVNATFPNDSISLSKMNALRNELSRLGGVESVSFSTFAPAEDGGWYTDLRRPQNQGQNADLIVAMKPADTSFFRLYGLSLVAGRIYFPSDTMREIVVNETLVRNLGIPRMQDILGQTLKVSGNNCVVVGVVKDYHVASLRDVVVPVVMCTLKNSYGLANLRIDLSKAKPVLSSMESIWNKLYPDFVFEYRFLEDSIAGFYQQEDRLSQLYKIFSAIAIVISCLGLYGLISFMAIRRRKEIGIRKVLGAPVRAILVLLSKEFSILIVIAFAIATPVAWVFMHKWLQQYSYRISLGVVFFVSTIAGCLVISWVTVGYTAMRAALANPSKSLRTE